MVSLVLVSHSKKLAEAAVEAVRQFSPAKVQITTAAGAGKDNSSFGTDATDIANAIRSVYSGDGVLVIMDMGSAVISSKLALEMLEPQYSKVKLCPGPFVEGAVAAYSMSSAGGGLDEVFKEASGALAAKTGLLES